jgi:hypothetical protein
MLGGAPTVNLFLFDWVTAFGESAPNLRAGRERLD